MTIPSPPTMTPHLDVVDLHARLVRFPSLSRQEGPIADFVEKYVRDPGIRTGRHDDNVYFSLGDGSRRLLLNTHLDVVPPSADHPYHPFEPTEADGKIYGRGAVDAKASAAAMTTAVLELAREGWQPREGQVIVALTTCEEIGGSYNGLEALRPHLPELDAAIVGEPTDLQPCVAQKGLLILTVRARGRTAHAARAHLGDNAILRAARDLQTLSTFQFEREDPYLGRPTLTVTTIEGGSARNVVPDVCTFTLDIRSTPAYTHDELIDELTGLLESDVEVHSKRLVPVATDPSESIVQACLRARPDAEPFGSPTASDWVFLRDLPVVKMGPGSSRLSHTADEHVEIEELRRGVETYKRVIKEYFR